MSPNTPVDAPRKDRPPSEAVVVPSSVSPKKKWAVRASVTAFPLVHVVWEDHHVSSDWKSPDELDPNPVIVLTVGWLVKENEQGLVLAMAMTLDDDGDIAYYTNVFTILKRTLVKMTVLKKASSKKTKQ